VIMTWSLSQETAAMKSLSPTLLPTSSNWPFFDKAGDKGCGQGSESEVMEQALI
jgi:hypothetical protein